jgi:hypothetical protein
LTKTLDRQATAKATRGAAAAAAAGVEHGDGWCGARRSMVAAAERGAARLAGREARQEGSPGLNVWPWLTHLEFFFGNNIILMENRKIIGQLDEIASLAPCRTEAVRKGTCRTAPVRQVIK